MLVQVFKVKAFKALGWSRVTDNTWRCCSIDNDDGVDDAAEDEECSLETILALVASAAVMAAVVVLTVTLLT